MGVRISDVAQKAGVAIGTVSRAFNGYQDIRPETRERIFLAAQELGYTPNISARNLSSKKPPNIGLIFSGLLESNTKDNLVYLQLQGMLRYATAHNLEVALYATDSAEQAEHSYAEFCAQHSISGTILSGITTDDAYFSELMNSGIPTVALDIPLEGENVGWVSVDNRAGAAEAVRFFYDMNRRDLLLVCGKRNTTVNTFRLQGVDDALQALGLAVSPADRLYCDFDEEVAYRKVLRRLNERGKAPDGVFCFSDVMAFGAMRALREKGLRIPEEVSVIGFDGAPLCELTVPSLSTVSQDMRGMGYEAVALLHDIMERRSTGGHRVLPHSLEIRESVCPRV